MSQEAVSGIWKILKYNLRASIIAKYYVQLMLLFLYRSLEIVGNAQETFPFKVQKTNTGVYVRNNLFTSVEEN
mgnify:CR=1 FL=1